MFENPRELVTTLGRTLARAGLDVVHAFDAQRYNAAVVGHAALRPLEPYERDDGTLAVLVGNTRALWAPFLAAYREDARLRDSTDPIDTYVEHVIARALARVPVPSRAWLASERGPGLVSMVHAARASGFAVLSPGQLAVHAELGPWFGLRAVILFDAPAPADLGEATDNPCRGCAEPCRPAFADAMASFRDEGSIAERWRTWLRVRDACPVGREHRYTDAQIRYHYTKDLSLLAQLSGD